jgi:acylpyruvate hydrolase
VIGKPGRRIAGERALDHVAGYSLFNDASVRDFQLRTPQWTMGKNFDGTGSFGPWLVTPDAVPPGARGLHIQGRLNGRVMQDSRTDLLIFSVPALIELPPVFMQPGDIFEVEIEELGTLSNTVRTAERHIAGAVTENGVTHAIF